MNYKQRLKKIDIVNNRTIYKLLPNETTPWFHNGRVTNIINLLINGVQFPDYVLDKLIGLKNTKYGVRSLVHQYKDKLYKNFKITIERKKVGSYKVFFSPDIPEFKGDVNHLCNVLGISDNLDLAHRNGGKKKGTKDKPHNMDFVESDEVVDNQKKRVGRPAGSKNKKVVKWEDKNGNILDINKVKDLVYLSYLHNWLIDQNSPNKMCKNGYLFNEMITIVFERAKVLR